MVIAMVGLVYNMIVWWWGGGKNRPIFIWFMVVSQRFGRAMGCASGGPMCHQRSCPRVPRAHPARFDYSLSLDSPTRSGLNTIQNGKHCGKKWP